MNQREETSGDDAELQGEPDSATAASRRNLLAKGGIAAAVATVAGVGLSRQASAADGDTMFVGNDHTGTDNTTLSGSSFEVSDGGDPSGSIIGTSSLSSGTGVLGSVIGPGGVGVQGRSQGAFEPNGRAVSGEDSTDAGIGVYGQHGSTFPGVGMSARSLNGTGLVASGTVADESEITVMTAATDSVDIRLAGTGLLEFTAEQATDASTVGAAGRLARGTDGNLWFSVADDTWVQLTGVPRDPVFTPVEPFRVYDSRLDAAGRLPAQSSRILPVRDAIDVATGEVSMADAVPVGATAISFNLTAADTTDLGFLALAPGDATEAKASTINWSTSTTIANAGIVAIDGSRQTKVFVGPVGTAHVVLDVTGYWSV